jgi:predicted NBD/HSP70 family sugar kinase
VTDDIGLAGTRELNRLRVMQALLRNPGSSRNDVARLTGLSRPTVSTLVDELESAGIVHQHAERDAGRPRPTGRPPMYVSLAPDAAFAVGLDFGHTHIRAGVCDLSGAPIADVFSPAEVDHAPAASLDLARELVLDALREAKVEREHVIGVGMGLAAPIDSATRTVYAEGILPSWGGLSPADEMESRLGLPVQIENDANVGALGEHMFGAGRGVDDMVYVRLSAGIGLGLILGGRPYRGKCGVAGELGHITSVEDGRICRCGNRGCLETLVRTPVLLRLLEPTHGANLTVARMVELAHGGDIACRRLIMDAGRQVGLAAANMCNLLNPERIVLGGELSQAADLLIEPMQDVISRHGIPSAARRVQIVQAALGSRSQVLGAVALALRAADRSAARFPDMIQKLNI